MTHQYIFRSLIWPVILSLGIVSSLSPTAADRPPNVIVILTDDQGWGDLSVNGNNDLRTPHLDSLAKDGARFDRFFVSPVCSPTRAEFLTGRYHLRGGVYSTSAGGERLDLGVATIADTFRQAGYATAAIGKWHNGMQYPYHPNGRGFDEFYGFCSGHWGHYYDPLLEHNGRLVRGQGYVSDDFTNHAVKFIREHRESPFFVYLAYNTPHSPMQVPESFWQPFVDRELTMKHRFSGRENLNHTRAALAMCENIDWNVGRILRQLEDSKLADDTIVVFFCDNGPNGSRWNGDMKGRKGSTDEGGVRSPLFIRWPDRIAAGKTVRQISAAIDLLPTLADLAGIPTASTLPLDGVSLKPLLLASPASWPDRLIFSHWRNRTSVRSQRFRLDHQQALFDMINDPGQRNDVRAAHPEIHRHLTEAADRWNRNLGPEEPRTKRPFTIGDATYRFTQLPARDATALGEIERSSRHPNCSYFTNWRSEKDYLYWDVEVLHAGEYAVDVYYACAADDVGVELALSLKDARIQGTVAVANDPPTIGAERDLSPRTESLVKDFRPLRLGTIELSPGLGRLKLEAVNIPGDQAIDFRLLMLTRNP